MAVPSYIIDETLLRRNLRLISSVAEQAGVEIILAFKAFALWKTFPIIREYVNATTASSLNEARLGKELFGAPCHTYSPAYIEEEMEDIVRCSSHVTFNSLSQLQRLGHYVEGKASIGLRVNPERSEIATALYDPCAPGSRFGTSSQALSEREGDTGEANAQNSKFKIQNSKCIDGFHVHCHCESSAEEFERTVKHVEEKFGQWLPMLKWINFGGGHLMTRKDYNVGLLIDLLKGFKERHPNLHVILEPGSAFAWQTGGLHSHVVDIVENRGIRTAILDVSFTCHMPDCLEMPYWPVVRGAQCNEGTYPKDQPHTYRLGGNSCLSGDWMESWTFDHELQIGEELVLEDMIHYTTVKTTMFNGIQHPDIMMRHEDGTMELLRHFTFEDYRDRMD